MSRVRCPAVLVLKPEDGMCLAGNLDPDCDECPDRGKCTTHFKGMVVGIGGRVGGRILAVSIKEREDVEKALKDADHIMKRKLVVDDG